MNVLSLFDGISCGQIALNKAKINYHNYYASEIDRHAIGVTQSNFPETVQLGDVNNWERWVIEKPEIILAGSPCQGFSVAGKKLNFKDSRSKLFFVFLDILNFYKPKYFLLENVKMKKNCQDLISKKLGVEPVLINSNLFSAQNRERLYWTNINIGPIKPVDSYINSIIEPNSKVKTQLLSNNKRVKAININHRGYRPHRGDARSSGISELGTILRTEGEIKTNTLTTSHQPKIVVKLKYGDIEFRKLSPLECERLQTVPDNYTKNASDAQRYKMLGNGWTVDVIVHILKGIKDS